MTTTSNIVLLIIFVIGVIHIAIGTLMIVSDIIDDVANHSITSHLLTLIIGIVLIGVSASFGLKKVGLKIKKNTPSHSCDEPSL